MKLGKDEIQKMVLGGLMLAALLYGYFAMLLGPLGASRELNAKKVTEVRAKIAECRKQIKKTQDLENAAPEHALLVKHISALIPEGAPVAWFPVRVTDLFKQYGIERTVTRMGAEQPEKEIAGYKRISWGIELPKAEFLSMAEAVAGFENTELLTEISALQIETTLEDAGAQHVLLTVNNIVKQ